MARFKATLIFGSRAASFNLFLYALNFDISPLRHGGTDQLGHIHDLYTPGLELLDPFPELDKAPRAGGDDDRGTGLQKFAHPVGSHDMAYLREDHLETPSPAAAGGPLLLVPFYLGERDPLDGAQDLAGFLSQAEVPGKDARIVVGDGDLVGEAEFLPFFYRLPDHLHQGAA